MGELGAEASIVQPVPATDHRLTSVDDADLHTDRMTDIALLFQAGANACFLRGATPLTFLKSLELVMLGETFLPSAILLCLPNGEAAQIPAPAEGPLTARLSVREECILRSLVEGHPNKAIANTLGIAAATC